VDNRSCAMTPCVIVYDAYDDDDDDDDYDDNGFLAQKFSMRPRNARFVMYI